MWLTTITILSLLALLVWLMGEYDRLNRLGWRLCAVIWPAGALLVIWLGVRYFW
jgi:hypothetical protein